MRNRDMPANPVVLPTENGQLHTGGLTKLEYAAIHSHIANLQRSPYADAEAAIAEANLLFDELEKQQ